MKYTINNLQRVINSDTGKDLKEWLLDKIEEVKYIDNIDTSLNVSRTGINIKVAKKTYQKLLEIFKEVIDFGNMRSTHNPKDDYYN